MNKITRLALLTHALLGFALTPVPAQTPNPPGPTTPEDNAQPTPTPPEDNARPKPSPSEGTAQPTPTPTLGDHFSQVLPDRHVVFRLLAPKANAVDVAIGIKSGPYELQGTTTAPMARD